jgi:protein-S-isoprenylcysteine O-methyltransferase Ste14
MNLRTRVARPASIRVNALKSAAYTAALWIVFLFGLPSAIRWAESRLGLGFMRFDPSPGRLAAIGLFCAASFVGFWSGYTLVTRGDGTPMPLECTRNLVIAGPYRHIRNPMSAMGIVQGLCVGLFLGSFSVIAYSIAGAFAWNYLLRPWEEQDLRDRFGAAYEQYRRSVPCWRPLLNPYIPNDGPPQSQPTWPSQ